MLEEILDELLKEINIEIENCIKENEDGYDEYVGGMLCGLRFTRDLIMSKNTQQ